MDDAAFAKAVAAAVAGQPMVASAAAPIPGRVLLVDGDAAAYTCAGGAETVPGQARANLVNTINQAKRRSQSSTAIILLTARGSHKGHRYAVARVKAYQGHRDGGHRPRNWEYLRTLLESGQMPDYPVVSTATAEADDLFGFYSKKNGPENTVIFTQDKDMRMTPGHHLDWKDMRMTYLQPDTYEHIFNDKVYGRKWFWLQMLHGDTADYVPGLPKCLKPNGKFGQCGEATAAKLLEDTTTETEARAVVFGQYKAYWEDEWKLNLLEQAILLWMRNDQYSSALNVLAPGNPLHGLEAVDEVKAILQRMAEAQV